MNKLEERYGWLSDAHAYVSRKHEDDKVIVFERAGVVFCFNFNTSKSFVDYRVGVEVAGDYRVVLDTDQVEFGGQGRILPKAADVAHVTKPEAWDNRKNSMYVYLPARTAIAFASTTHIAHTAAAAT